MKRSLRTTKQKKIRLPGGKLKTHFITKKCGDIKCRVCGAKLAGTASRVTAKKRANMAKTEKRPTRPFAGVLCSPCTARVMTIKSRGYAEYDLRYKPYVLTCK